MSLLTFLACHAPLPSPAPGAPAALHDAHDAWVRGDLPAVTEAVHDVLAADPPAHVEDNALALLDAAFQQHPHLPADQVLPTGVRAVALEHVHRVGPDGHRFRLVLRVHTDEDVVDGLHLKGPDGLVSTERFSTSRDGDQLELELELPDGPLPAPAGLYDLTLVVSGVEHDLWAALTDHTASEVPTVDTPHPGQVLQTRHPSIRFVPEATPEHLQGESTWSGLWLASRPDFQEVWSKGTDHPTGETEVDVALPDGPYWLAVSRREARSIGPVSVVRIARRGVPFEVRVSD